MNRYLREQISPLTLCRCCWRLRISSLAGLSHVVYYISTTQPPTCASILEPKVCCQLLLSNLYNVGLWLLCIKIKMLLAVLGLLVKIPYSSGKRKSLHAECDTQKIWAHEENSEGLKVCPHFSVCFYSWSVTGEDFLHLLLNCHRFSSLFAFPLSHSSPFLILSSSLFYFFYFSF